MNGQLIRIDANKPTAILADEIRKWFQENGTLAFEHGFQAGIITFNHGKYRPYMCDEGGVSVKGVERIGIFKISWQMLPKQTLLKIVRECNRYYQYVMTKV